MRWIGIFGRQLARDVLVSSALALAGGLALFVAVDFVETGNQATSDVSLGHIFRLELVSLPLVALQIAQLAAAIGAASATAALLRRNEIVAMLAAGAHPSILLRPIILVGALFAALSASVTEFVAPGARAEVLSLRKELGLPVKSNEILQRHQTWFRGEDQILRVDEIIDRDGTILSTVMILKIEGGRLLERLDVERIEYVGRSWIGHGIVKRRFHGDELSTSRADQAALDLVETPQDFIRIIGAPDRMTYAALSDSVAARERLGQPAIEHRLELYRRHAGPLMILLAVVLSVAMILRTSRRPSMATALAAGASIGFLLWLFDEIALALGSTSALPPWIAAHASVVFAAVCVVIAWLRAFRRGIAD